MPPYVADQYKLLKHNLILKYSTILFRPDDKRKLSYDQEREIFQEYGYGSKGIDLFYSYVKQYQYMLMVQKYKDKVRNRDDYKNLSKDEQDEINKIFVSESLFIHMMERA